MELDDLLKQIKQKPDHVSKDSSSKSTPRKNQNQDEMQKITPQMQKKITDFLNSDNKPEKPEQKSKHFLDKKTFVFIPYSSVLDKGKIDKIVERIRRRGGITFFADFFDWKKTSFLEIFVIASKEMPYNVTIGFDFLKSVPQSVHKNLDSFVFVDLNWILECVNRNEFLNYRPYQINWEKVRAAEENARLEQARREEEAKRKEAEDVEILEREIPPSELVKQPIKEKEEPAPREVIKVLSKEPRKTSSEEDDREEAEGFEDLSKPKKKLKLRENETIMNTYRHLYDYRFGIEEEKMESEPSPEKK